MAVGRPFCRAAVGGGGVEGSLHVEGRDRSRRFLGGGARMREAMFSSVAAAVCCGSCCGKRIVSCFCRCFFFYYKFVERFFSIVLSNDLFFSSYG